TVVDNIGKFVSVNDNDAALNVDNIIVMDMATGNVGIGTTVPGATLEVKAGADATIPAIIEGNSATQSANLLQIKKNSGATPSFVIDSGGQVGIGSTVPAQALDVVGNIALTGNITLDGTVDGIDIDALNTTVGTISTTVGTIDTGAEMITAINAAATTINDARLTLDIVNADINAGAAIVDTKLATIATAGKVSDSALSATVTKLGQTIETGEIANDTIINEDINSSAAIVDTKLATISTAGKVSGSAVQLATVSGLDDSTGLRIAGAAAGNGLAGGAGSALSVNVDGTSIAITTDTLGVVTNGIDDTHIDWGTSTNQVSTADVPEQTNLYYTDARVDTRLDTDETIGGNWTFSNALTIAAPTTDSHAATKLYVDQGIAGLSWKEAAMDLITDNTALPPDETTGNRYILTTTGGAPHANWDGAEAGDMVEFDGSVWVEEDPQDGDAVFIEDIDTGYVYADSLWTPFTGASAYTWGNGLDSAGNTVSVGAGAGIDVAADTVIHEDMSSQATVDNSDGTFIQDITMGDLGHVTGITSVDLDGRYYTETEADANYLGIAAKAADSDKLDNIDSTGFAILSGQAGGQTIQGDTAASGNLTLDSTANATKGYVLINPTSGSVGIGEVAPATLLELSSTTPYITIHNTTEENIEGGREGQILFKGEQDGTEETTLAKIQASHDGTADDEKGDLIFYVNDGDDADSPTERMRIDSAGTVTAATFAGNLTGDVTGNVSGSSGSTTGLAATATALATARNIGGTSFDGTADITPANITVADTTD
ncbi:beta strand repeat-containing protein, partial [Candidatus Omnitrophota bacterium]